MNDLDGKTIKSHIISKLKISIKFTDNTTLWIEPTNVHETLAIGMTMPIKKSKEK